MEMTEKKNKKKKKELSYIYSFTNTKMDISITQGLITENSQTIHWITQKWNEVFKYNFLGTP